MNSNSDVSRRKTSRSSKPLAAIVVVLLLGLYALARPALNERFGWKLPEIATQTDQTGSRAVSDSPTDATETIQKGVENEFNGERHRNKAEIDFVPITRGDDDRVGSLDTDKRGRAEAGKPIRKTASDATSVAKKSTASAGQETNDDLLYGLCEIGPDRYLSPAGLQYTPGSAEGHRLDHLRRHVEDQPGRPGSHGVFDGGMEGALTTIDRAYERAKKGQRTTKTTDQGRTIYTVDMGGRIGFVGGRDGGRRRNPMARRVRLILEGTRVITAYPM